MKVSIIIPAFNSEGYISDCIDSCVSDGRISQDELEIIIVDDGSTDKTAEIVVDYQARYSNIILVLKKNGGVSSARNAGLEIATGVFVIFVDSDDELFSYAIYRMFLELQRQPVELLIMNSRIFGPEISGQEIYIVPKELRNISLSGFELFHRGYSRGSACGVAFRREFLRINRIYFAESIQNGEDSLFMTLCFMHSDVMRCVDLDFYKVKIRVGSASRSWDSKRLFNFISSLRVLKGLIETNDFNTYQLSMINVKAYRVISNIIFQYWRMPNRPPFSLVKRQILDSGMYPIRTSSYKCSRSKIYVLNLSLQLFAALTLIYHRFRLFWIQIGKLLFL